MSRSSAASSAAQPQAPAPSLAVDLSVLMPAADPDLLEVASKKKHKHSKKDKKDDTVSDKHASKAIDELFDSGLSQKKHKSKRKAGSDNEGTAAAGAVTKHKDKKVKESKGKEKSSAEEVMLRMSLCCVVDGLCGLTGLM